jgi:peptide/nickel transport system permease protein
VQRVRRFVLSRLGSAAILIAALIVTNFVLTHLIPGDPVDALVGDFPAPREYLDQVRHDFGLDQPLAIQLWLYIQNLAHGNLGFSFANRQPVLPLLLQRALFTLMLMLPALTVASFTGVLLGGMAARRVGSTFDLVLSAVTLFGYSVPIFWLAQVFIVVFAVYFRVLPAQGMLTAGADNSSFPRVLGDYLRHLVLPGIAVAVAYLAVVARVARASLVEAMQQDFTLLALAKGLSPSYTFWRHVLPNALIPVITVIGYNFGYAITGAILTETVFGWPGVGYLFIDSISKRDYPVLDGIFLFTTFTVIVANLLTDLAYAVADPRVARSFASVR